MEETIPAVSLPSTQSRQSVFEKISFFVLLATSFLIPIFFVPSPFVSTDFGTSLLFAGGVIVSLLCYVISLFLAGSFSVPKSTKIALGLFVTVPLVYFLAGISNGFSRQIFIGQTFDQSTVGFVALAFVYLFLVSVLFRDMKRIFYSFLAFLASSVVFFAFIISRLMFGVNFLSFGIFTSLTTTMIGSWNNVAMFAAIGVLLSCISVSLLDASRLMKVLLTIAFLISLFFLVLVNFNFIWITVGVSALLFIIYKMCTADETFFRAKTFGEKIRSVPLYPFILLVISIVFIFWGTSIVTHLGSVFNQANIEVRPSLSVTLDIARQTIQTRPLFGSGPGNFVTQWIFYKPTSIINTDFWNTDFQYGIGLLPTFAVTTGLIGILSWLVFFISYLYLGWKTLRARLSNSFVSYLAISSFFVSLYLWIMTVIYLPSIVMIVLTFLFTGLFLASLSLTDIFPMTVVSFSTNPRKGFGWSLCLVAVCVLAIVLGYSLIRNSEAQWYYQKSSYALNTTGDIAQSETLMKQAVAVVPYDVYYRGLTQIEITKLGQVEAQDPKAVGTTTLQQEVTSTLSDAITAGLNARAADPSNYLNWVSLGQAYESAVPLKIQGAYQSAQGAYNQAFLLNQKNPGIALLMAQLEMDNGSATNATADIQQALQMKPNYLDAYMLLAQIDVANNDAKSAIAAVTNAVTISPNDPSILFQLGYLQFSAGDYTDAVTSLQKSLALSPQYANAQYYLGLSYEATGDHADAIAQFTDLSKTNPGNASVTEILTALQAGKPIFQPQQPAPVATSTTNKKSSATGSK